MHKRVPEMGTFFIHFMTFTSNLLLGWFIILPPGIGWYIMGYESDPLHSYPELSNFSYSVKLITPLPSLFLCLIYRVLILPEQHPDCPRHPLRFHVQFTERPAGHPIRYGCLWPLYVYYDGVEPCRVHCLLYRWILPLSVDPTFFHHLHDPSRHMMAELRQDLDHLPGNYQTLASIE